MRIELEIEGITKVRGKGEDCFAPATRGLVGDRGVDADIENGPGVVERTCLSEHKYESEPAAELPESDTNILIRPAPRRPTADAVCRMGGTVLAVVVAPPKEVDGSS